MKVARQFIAWMCLTTDPSRRVRSELVRSDQGGRRRAPPQSHRTLRDGSFLAIFLAVNCQPTIVPSLRDKRPSGDLSAKSTPRHLAAEFEDEDDDEYENEGPKRSISAHLRQLFRSRFLSRTVP